MNAFEHTFLSYTKFLYHSTCLYICTAWLHFNPIPICVLYVLIIDCQPFRYASPYLWNRLQIRFISLWISSSLVFLSVMESMRRLNFSYRDAVLVYVLLLSHRASDVNCGRIFNVWVNIGATMEDLSVIVIYHFCGIIKTNQKEFFVLAHAATLATSVGVWSGHGCVSIYYIVLQHCAEWATRIQALHDCHSRLLCIGLRYGTL